MLARSGGPGGQRKGIGGGLMMAVPPLGMAWSCFCSSNVCGPAFQACGITGLAASS